MNACGKALAGVTKTAGAVGKGIAAVQTTMQMEQFSRAYVAAIAAQAGCNPSRPEVDEDSVDLALAMKGITGCKRTRANLEIQIKCTGNADLSQETFSYALPVKNYDDLRADVVTPRLLVVVCVPHEIEDWTQQTEEQLCLRRCAYWLSLAGMPETDNSASVTVQIPRTNIFSVDFLREAMRRSANGKTL